MMESLRLAPVPPPPGPRDEVRRLKAGDEIHFCVLSRALWGVWTHWDGARSFPCHREKVKCQGCTAGVSARWKGYLHVFVTGERKDVFLELTPKSAELVQSQADDANDLRGISYSMSRGKGDKARLRVIRIFGRLKGEDLPPEKDPAPVLIVLWQMPARGFGALTDPRSRFSSIDRC
jgi:hypothetical protein